jgi:sulfite reductase alpha subunit-like flavoprotein
MDQMCPAIFVATGTGIAPFRSFWMERAARARYTSTLAPAVLFFGCRSKATDCLFLEVCHKQTLFPQPSMQNPQNG